MITAVQRKTEYCGARMAAVGSWEIGILERHFRVSASSCFADHQQSCFPIVGPLAFRHPSTNLETRLPILIEYLPTLLSFFPFAIFLSSPFRGSSREFLKRDAEKIISKYFVTNGNIMICFEEIVADPSSLKSIQENRLFPKKKEKKFRTIFNFSSNRREDERTSIGWNRFTKAWEEGENTLVASSPKESWKKNGQFQGG